MSLIIKPYSVKQTTNLYRHAHTIGMIVIIELSLADKFEAIRVRSFDDMSNN